MKNQVLEIKFILKNNNKNIFQSDDVTGKFCQTLIDKVRLILNSIFQKTEEEETLPTFLYEATSIPIPNQKQTVRETTDQHPS